MSTVETVEPIDERGSAVRFETQCVVIPDPAHRSRRPRVVTKSYALPLWKRRTLPEDASFEEKQSHLVLRLPLPTISLKPHSATRSVDLSPLPPCLVHRPQPASPACPSSSSLNRHARTPRKPSPSPSRPDVVTIPLRPCCAACQSVTEAALVENDAWPVHFSRAATRQRSLSADGGLRTLTVAGSAAAASYGSLGVSISVDEIDKRRRASDTGPPPTSKWPLSAKPGEEYRVPLVHCRNASSNASPADPRNPPSPSRVTPATPRIPEEEDDENENELFPLPSPKRTPTTSPAPSLAGSLSSLMVAQPNQSAGASPSHSTCSGDSAALAPNNLKRHFLAPPTCSSSSSLSLPKLSESATDLSLTEDPPRVPSPSLLSALPSLSNRHPSPRIALPAATDSTPSTTPRASEPVPIPSPRSPAQPSSSPHLSPRLPWRSKRSASSDMNAIPSSPIAPTHSSISTPPLPTTTPTRKSYSMSSPLQVFADVFRGVGTMGS